jgi:predicted ATPase with chaperone activity
MLAKAFSCEVFGLEVMRQPMEDKVVATGRAQGALAFAANFTLVAAVTSCPWGTQMRQWK